MRYIALLRGVNVGGNNKVPMGELKACFEKAGFLNVSTYINSGNVLFDADETDIIKLICMCEELLLKQFGFPVSLAERHLLVRPACDVFQNQMVEGRRNKGIPAHYDPERQHGKEAAGIAIAE